jgi:hypothetical protein
LAFGQSLLISFHGAVAELSWFWLVTDAGFVLHGFNCVLRFDQGFGLAAEYFRDLPVLP